MKLTDEEKARFLPLVAEADRLSTLYNDAANLADEEILKLNLEDPEIIRELLNLLPRSMGFMRAELRVKLAGLENKT